MDILDNKIELLKKSMTYTIAKETLEDLHEILLACPSDKDGYRWILEDDILHWTVEPVLPQASVADAPHYDVHNAANLGNDMGLETMPSDIGGDLAIASDDEWLLQDESNTTNEVGNLGVLLESGENDNSADPLHVAFRADEAPENTTYDVAWEYVNIKNLMSIGAYDASTIITPYSIDDKPTKHTLRHLCAVQVIKAEVAKEVFGNPHIPVLIREQGLAIMLDVKMRRFSGIQQNDWHYMYKQKTDKGSYEYECCESIPHITFFRKLVEMGLTPKQATSGVLQGPKMVKEIAFSDLATADVDQVNAVTESQLRRHPDMPKLKEFKADRDKYLVVTDVCSRTMAKQLWTGLLRGGGGKHIKAWEEKSQQEAPSHLTYNNLKTAAAKSIDIS